MSKKLERKFKKNVMINDKNLIKKTYKDDDEQEQITLIDQYEQKHTPQVSTKTGENDIRQLYDFVDTSGKFDPFQDINPLTQKIEIAKNQKYNCTSQSDVLIQRERERQKVQFSKMNPFLITPEEKALQNEEEQDEYVNNDAFHIRLKL